jgi:diguanylate cyclase (GGDEF)-like protein/PAS domain S-box-containing protein
MSTSFKRVESRRGLGGTSTPLRALIVEDSEDDALQVLRVLKRAGYVVSHERVESPGGMRAALDGQAWDIVICDFRMSGFDGRAALAMLRERNPDLPFIVVSGAIGEDTAVEMMKAGASDYVMKGNLTRLVPAVQRELREAEVRREHRQVENALRESEERHRTLFNSIDESFCIIEVIFDEHERPIDYRFLEINPSFAKQTGMIGAQGKRMRELAPRHEEHWFEIYGRIALTGQPARFENHAEQLHRWFDVYAFRVGEPIHRQVAIRFSDITERKLAAEALQASEAEFHVLAEALPQIVWIARADGMTVYLNRRWVDYTGVTAADGLVHSWRNLTHPEDQQRTWEAWQHALASGGSYSIETRLRRADGVFRWWLIRAVPMRDATGNVQKWFGTCTDIHDLKIAGLEISLSNGALRESERRFADMLNNVDMASMMLDANANITYCNDYLLQLTGWRREDVLGQNWFELFIPPSMDDVKSIFATLVADLPGAGHYENGILTRSGEIRLIRWNNSLLRSAGGAVIGTASIGEDITEQRRAEIRIKRLNRVYAVLSQINALIVRVHDREELFRETCRIAVDAGAFRMAWIGVVDPQTSDGKVVAWHGGEEGFVDIVRFTARDGTPDSDRPASRALRLSQPVTCNNIATDPSLAPLRDELLRRGHKSVGCFPLTVAGQPEAVIVLFAGESDVFDDEETRLLLELAGNISFALDHIENQERLDYLAFYDALTGLANRRLFLERVNLYISTAVSSNHQLGLCLFDIERFKNINDTYGRPAGDALLKQVAQWLTNTCGDAIVLARVGADLFAVVLPRVAHEEDVARLLEKAAEAFMQHTFQVGAHEFRLAAKVGVALFPDDGTNADSLFANAEVALKKAKASGDRYLFYAEKMTATVAGTLALEFQLRLALERQEFRLHYQPKINLATGKLTGAEALIRWLHPGQGLVPPNRFIPILEETGLIFAVGRWALQTAIADYLRWRAAGLQTGRIAVNVSALQLRNRGFVAEIEEAVGIDAHAAEGLELEITESMIMDDIVRSTTTLQAIRAMGVKIAIDDFGTGFSSLSYLAKLPVDTLKIDRSFIVEMTGGSQGRTLVSTIINLGHSLKLNVVAEGVETEEQSQLLRTLDCDEMQGWLFSKALPVDEFETLLRKIKQADIAGASTPGTRRGGL